MDKILKKCGRWAVNKQIEIFVDIIIKDKTVASNQLLVMTAATAIFAYVPVFRYAIPLNDFSSIAQIMFLTFCLLLALYIKRRQFPIKWLLFAIFIAMDCMIIGVAIRMYDTGVIVKTVILMFIFTFCLMVYNNYQEGRDFTETNVGGLLVIFVVVSLLVIMNIGGSVLFDCLFIIFQTQMMMMKMSYDDYTFAIIGLFFNIMYMIWKLRGYFCRKPQMYCNTCDNFYCCHS